MTKCCRCGGRATNGIEIENTVSGEMEALACCDPCLPAVTAALARGHGRSDEEASAMAEVAQQWDALHHTGALGDHN